MEVKEKPILFSAAMVRAFLDDKKLATRRIIKPQPVLGKVADCPDYDGGPMNYDEVLLWEPKLEEWKEPRKELRISDCPYGKVGDRLWVREAFRYYFDHDNLWDCIQYRADMKKIKPDIPSIDIGCHFDNLCECGRDGKGIETPWRPSIHMPRWASRILLEITDIKPQRLQDITEDEAIAEGISRIFDHLPKAEYDDWRRRRKKYSGIIENLSQEQQPFTNYLWHGHIGKTITAKQSDAWDYQESGYESAVDSFSSLWESINGIGSWARNDWVWAVSLKKIEVKS